MIKSSNLHGEGIVELPLHAIIFSIHDKLKGWRRTKTPMTQEFHILVPSFFSRCEEYNLLLALLRNCCFWWINFYSSVSTKCYLNQYPYFGNNRISCKDVQSPEFVISKHEIFSASKFDSKNCVSNHQGRWWLISKNAKTYAKTSLLTEDVIINLSQVLKWLEHGVYAASI